jgi:Predicted glutamine amidotransferases
MNNRPIVGIVAGTMELDAISWHSAGESSLIALTEVSGCNPVIIPALGNNLNFNDILDDLDGLFLSGGATNIHPKNYSGKLYRDKDLYDRKRDGTSIPLIKLAIEKDIPIFAICRGFQELNVALGGSLYSYLHEEPGKFDHRRDRTKSIEYQTIPSHYVNIQEDGLVNKILNKKNIKVNSLHGQGINKLGEDLKIEAVAEDSTIEAISYTKSNVWSLGVQWHPELSIDHDLYSRELFKAYGAACKIRKKKNK